MATIINESTARLAKQMRSFDDYKEGSATASYNAQCAVSETDDDVPAIAFALSRRTMSHFEQV